MKLIAATISYCLDNCCTADQVHRKPRHYYSKTVEDSTFGLKYIIMVLFSIVSSHTIGFEIAHKLISTCN